MDTQRGAFVTAHLSTRSLRLPLSCSLPGWDRCCLSRPLDSFSAAAMGHPERLAEETKAVTLHHADVDSLHA